MGRWLFGWLASDGFVIDVASCGRGQWPALRPARKTAGQAPAPKRIKQASAASRRGAASG
jgi:hypothetical protein